MLVEIILMYEGTETDGRLVMPGDVMHVREDVGRWMIKRGIARLPIIEAKPSESVVIQPKKRGQK